MLVAALCILVACTGGSNKSHEPVDTLHAAAVATLASKSFHADVTMTVPTSNPPTGTGTVDYQAPNMEVEHLGPGPKAAVTISIGDTAYVTVPGQPGYFWTAKHPGSSGVGDTLGPIQWIAQAESVRFDGHSYTFELPASLVGALGAAKGVATISDGRLETFNLHYVPTTKDMGDVSMSYTYSAYDELVDVQAPPGDHIVTQNPLTTCPCAFPAAASASKRRVM